MRPATNAADGELKASTWRGKKTPTGPNAVMQHRKWLTNYGPQRGLVIGGGRPVYFVWNNIWVGFTGQSTSTRVPGPWAFRWKIQHEPSVSKLIGLKNWFIV